MGYEYGRRVSLQKSNGLGIQQMTEGVPHPRVMFLPLSLSHDLFLSIHPSTTVYIYMQE